MTIYKPSELRLFLDRLGMSPKKGLSQNFLIDGNIVRKIASASDVNRDDVVLEIGPGPGALTQALLESGAQVIAVEKDQLLAHELDRLQTSPPQLKVCCADILSFPVQQELSSLLQHNQKAKVIANLPYHLTTPIIALLVPMQHLFSSLTVMVQEEVARRMTAEPRTAAYGSLTLFLRFYTDPKYAFTVSRNCFYPSPKVDSAVVVLELRKPPLDESEIDPFFKITRKAFEHRRKMLRASLKTLYSPHVIEEALSAIGESPIARPEDLSLEKFIALYGKLGQF